MSYEFNENFYIVTATIIPIFYLALTLQSPFYSNAMENIKEDTRKTVKATEEKRALAPGIPLKDRDWSSIGRVFALWCLRTTITFAGIWGEILALAALYHQQASAAVQSFVFWSTVGVISLTAVTPALGIARVWGDAQRADKRYIEMIRREQLLYQPENASLSKSDASKSASGPELESRE